MRLAVAVVLLASFSSAAVVPTVSYIEPASGLLSGGTEICVFGENLAMMQFCRVGDNPGELTFANPDGTKACFRTPRGETASVYRVQISEEFGLLAKWIPETPRNSTFKYYTPPNIISVLPNSGPATGGQEVTVQTDNSILTSTTLHLAKCLFGSAISPVTSYSCHGTTCYLKCRTPEMCKILDPVDEVNCQEKTTTFYLSLNGQDFTTDTKTKPTYRFDNVWAHPA